MFRALTIIIAIAALAGSAAPASAGTKPPPRQYGNVENIDPFVGMVRLPRPPALHENEGIDGGFRRNSHKRRLVSQHGDIKY